MIITANGKISRPISKLYPLELTSKQDGHTVEEVNGNLGIPDTDPGQVSEERRPCPAAARRTTDKVKEWVRVLVLPGGCHDGRSRELTVFTVASFLGRCTLLYISTHVCNARAHTF